MGVRGGAAKLNQTTFKSMEHDEVFPPSLTGTTVALLSVGSSGPGVPGSGGGGAAGPVGGGAGGTGGTWALLRLGVLGLELDSFFRNNSSIPEFRKPFDVSLSGFSSSADLTESRQLSLSFFCGFFSSFGL